MGSPFDQVRGSKLTKRLTHRRARHLEGVGERFFVEFLTRPQCPGDNLIRDLAADAIGSDQ